MERNWGCDQCSMAAGQGHILTNSRGLGLHILKLYLGPSYHLVIRHPIRSLQQHCHKRCSIVISMDFLIREYLCS